FHPLQTIDQIAHDIAPGEDSNDTAHRRMGLSEQIRNRNSRRRCQLSVCALVNDIATGPSL
ncbi:hypothetical protein, partial [Blastomonas fulva]|uniref:hypothetical protein n=1 Tax=Blastomonas fulva TaxID=1550728 RepID=UPI003F6F8ED2